MKRNCNLKLELQPPVSDSESSPEEEQQKLTIFYGGQVCVCDVSEFQARAILLLASRELNTDEENKRKSPAASSNSSGDTANYGIAQPSPTTPAAAAAATGLSMQRSLQRFLQKRKHRSHVATAHPYRR